MRAVTGSSDAGEPDASEVSEFMGLESRPLKEISAILNCQKSRAIYSTLAQRIVRWLTSRERKKEPYTESHFQLRAVADWFLFEVRQFEVKMRLPELCDAVSSTAAAAKTASDVADEVYDAIIELSTSKPTASHPALRPLQRAPMKDVQNASSVCRVPCPEDKNCTDQFDSKTGFEELLAWFEDATTDYEQKDEGGSEKLHGSRCSASHKELPPAATNTSTTCIMQCGQRHDRLGGEIHMLVQV
jgi:hypothetical protein